ncbi:MAG: DNA-directed RNA polymerase subunit omega [Deltaproteobacteria bacterium]|nr:DNA-directed RNA polymerase subunit omega [Deltaproteobacteria bacterium]
MARVTVEDCLDRVDNRFALALLAARRARQIARGARPVVQVVKNKPAVVALREVAADKVRYDRNVKETLLKTSLADKAK